MALLGNATHSKGNEALKGVSDTQSNAKGVGTFRSYVAYEN